MWKWPQVWSCGGEHPFCRELTDKSIHPKPRALHVHTREGKERCGELELQHSWVFSDSLYCMLRANNALILNHNTVQRNKNQRAACIVSRADLWGHYEWEGWGEPMVHGKSRKKGGGAYQEHSEDALGGWLHFLHESLKLLSYKRHTHGHTALLMSHTAAHARAYSMRMTPQGEPHVCTLRHRQAWRRQASGTLLATMRLVWGLTLLRMLPRGSGSLGLTFMPLLTHALKPPAKMYERCAQKEYGQESVTQKSTVD